MRMERDFLGELEIPADALYGIHSLRARHNFPDRTPFHKEWYMALGLVKHACYETVLSFIDAATESYGNKQLPYYLQNPSVFSVMSEAALEVAAGDYFDHFVVPAIQGGAGTSINMNINEIIANVALKKMGERPGRYTLLDPIVHANIYQSTNDVVPTALKLGVMQLLQRLEHTINNLRSHVERLENASRNILRLAYTQMQEAVPSSYAMMFGAYNDALSRDWWRVSKCAERIKVVNLGGGAVGTGMGIPRYFIMDVVPCLQRISGLPLARSENLSDTTQNLDVFVEVHATLKAHAVNLEKMSADIRLLSSDVHGRHGISIPPRQAGSSIMPAKVNPVIPEFVISAVHKVYSNDMLISNLCGQGCLDLNPYLPVVGHALLESLKLLIGADSSLGELVFNDMQLDSEVSLQEVFRSASVATALVPHIGYDKATELAQLMKKNKVSVFEANVKLGFLTDERLRDILRPDHLLRLGYSLKDIQ